MEEGKKDLKRKKAEVRVKMKGENIEEKIEKQGEEAKRRKGGSEGMERWGNKGYMKWMSGYERGVFDARKPNRSIQAVQTTHNVGL
jgi:hypothetical protein